MCDLGILSRSQASAEGDRAGGDKPKGTRPNTLRSLSSPCHVTLLRKSFPEWDMFLRLPAGKVCCGNPMVWINVSGLEKSFLLFLAWKLTGISQRFSPPSPGTKATLS